MILKKKWNSLSQQILLKQKLNNTNNLLNLKYLFRYLGFKKSFSITKIKHNKIFFLKIQKKFITRQNGKQKFKRKFFLNSNNLGKLNLYKNFINFIFKSGKKHIWEKIISDIFLLIKKNLNVSQNVILLKIFLRLYSKIEIKKIKTRKKVVLVPVFISIKRRFFLALKWLLLAVSKNKLKISLKEKLFLEIFKLVKNKSCDSLKEMELNNEKVYLNRANFHYRW